MKRQSLAELADLCAVTSPDDAWDDILAHDSGVYQRAYDARVSVGESERYARAMAETLEEEEQDEQWCRYLRAVSYAVEYLMRPYGISLFVDGDAYVLTGLADDAIEKCVQLVRDQPQKGAQIVFDQYMRR